MNKWQKKFIKEIYNEYIARSQWQDRFEEDSLAIIIKKYERHIKELLKK